MIINTGEARKRKFFIGLTLFSGLLLLCTIWYGYNYLSNLHVCECITNNTDIVSGKVMLVNVTTDMPCFDVCKMYGKELTVNISSLK